MQNVIAACAAHNCKLIFLDNTYLYAKTSVGNITERSAIHPPGRKGKVRLAITRKLEEAVERGRVEALIGWAADFASLHPNSVLHTLVIRKLTRGEKAQWFANANRLHNFNQVWHLLTSREPMNGKDCVEHIAGKMGGSYRFSVLPAWAFTPLGLFVPVMKEVKEMLYQYERDYVFNSQKF
jgi:hypothetical protein